MTQTKPVFTSRQDVPERYRKILIGILAAVLFCIPLNYAFGSISSIVLVATAFLLVPVLRQGLSKGRFWIFPVAFYAVMALSLLWTTDASLTAGGLRKEASFLFIPLAFLCLPWLDKASRQRVFRIFSFSMAGYSIYYFGRATLRYFETGNKDAFFFHELVTPDVGAIYISVFASFAMFYFIALPARRTSEKIALGLLVILVFLLSSKTVVTIDFFLIICYYLFFSAIPQGVRTLTVISVTAFLLASTVFVPGIRERFVAEVETALVDNAVGLEKGEEQIDLGQAWNQAHFGPGVRFTGLAMRAYQVRIFGELTAEDAFPLLGYGLEASQEKIRSKALQDGLDRSYGDYNFHNQYIQTLAELGIPGLAVLLLMLGYNLKNGWSRKDFLHIAFAVMMMILFLTESFFCRHRGVLFFVLVYCLFNLPVKENKSVNEA